MSFNVDVVHRFAAKTITAKFGAPSGLTALVGPSGCGKTTTLNMIAGLVRPESGHIKINDTPLFDHAQSIDISVEHRKIGYVFQDQRLFPHMRVVGNLTYGAPRSRASAPSLADVAKFLDIEPLLNRWPGSLSGGEAQRVAIGRALLSDPEVLLLDEPFAGLDETRRGEIATVICRLRDERHMPILLVSHNRAEIQALATYIVDFEAFA